MLVRVGICVVLSAVLGCQSAASLSSKGKDGDKKKAGKTEDGKKPGDEEANDDNLRIVPPESVSGAYLVCADLDQSHPDNSMIYHGCATYDATKKRVRIQAEKKTYELRDKSHNKVDANQVTLAGRSEDVIWEVKKEVAAKGLEADLEVWDPYGKKVLDIDETPELSATEDDEVFTPAGGKVDGTSTDAGDPGAAEADSDGGDTDGNTDESVKI